MKLCGIHPDVAYEACNLAGGVVVGAALATCERWLVAFSAVGSAGVFLEFKPVEIRLLSYGLGLGLFGRGCINLSLIQKAIEMGIPVAANVRTYTLPVLQVAIGAVYSVWTLDRVSNPPMDWFFDFS